ncbi:hypothetical protein U1Q18_017303 [Sarracenia purpurea var. burkii]
MRASLTNLPFLGKISNGNVRYLNGAGGKYNNFGKPNALGRYTPLESQARYYSRCREEANLTQGRSVYERGGGIDKKKEAQTKYERKGGKSGMENRRTAKQQWGTLGADYNRGIQGIKGGTKERYGERVEKAKRPGAGIEEARSTPSRGSTIFIDNLPDLIHCQWLGRMFQQCGYVLEVKIPSKKRWKTNTKFGFVRFRSSAEAEEAMNNLNGAWCMDRRISVQKAYYDSKPREDTRKRSNEVVLRKKHRSPSVGTLGVERAEAKKGEGLVEMQQSRIMKRIEATEIDEAWTKFSLVRVIKDPKGGELLSEALFKGGSTPVSIKAIGGQKVLIIFQTLEDKCYFQQKHRELWEKWLHVVYEWSYREANYQRRAWLSIIGVPLHTWCEDTFSSLGEAPQ